MKPTDRQFAYLAETDPDLRSSPGVTIGTTAVPPLASSPKPAARTVVARKTFGDLAGARFNCASGELEREVLWHCLYPKSLDIARWVWRIHEDYFLPDLQLIRAVKNLTDVEDLASEFSDFQHRNLSRGFLRGRMRVRISGQRLVDLANELFQSAKV